MTGPNFKHRGGALCLDYLSSDEESHRNQSDREVGDSNIEWGTSGSSPIFPDRQRNEESDNIAGRLRSVRRQGAIHEGGMSRAAESERTRGSRGARGVFGGSGIIQDHGESPKSSFSGEQCEGQGKSALEALAEAPLASVQDILRRQEAVLSRRSFPLGRSPQGAWKKMRAHVRENDAAGGREMAIEDCWNLCLSRLDEDFFTGADARMEETGRVRKGETAYLGLPIDESNSEDMSHIYAVRYEAKRTLGQPAGSYNQFRTAIGQLARLHITLSSRGPSLAKNLWKEGHLFRAATDLNAVRALIGHFQIRGSASTVAAKSMHLKTLADFAAAHFTGRNEMLKGKAMTTGEYLLTVAGAQKKEARRAAAQRRSTGDRLSRGVMLLPEDFRSSLRRAKSELKGILASFRRERREKGEQGARQFLQERSSVVQKWSLNFLVALLIGGGGQRPQVYSQMQLPDAQELVSMKRQAERDGFFEIRAVIEKTTRSFDLPNIVLPSPLLPFVCFQVQHIRPLIVRKTGVDETRTEIKTLLVNTRTGLPLRTEQIQSSLRRFLTRIDPELALVTPMSIRASYATMMVQAFREKKLFRGKSEREFLEFLAKSMNTSVEQLASVYAGCDTNDFRSCCRELSNILEQPGGTEGIESDGEEGGTQGSQLGWLGF